MSILREIYVGTYQQSTKERGNLLSHTEWKKSLWP